MIDDLRTLAAAVRRAGGMHMTEAQLPGLLAALARLDPLLTAEDLLRDPGPVRLERLVDQLATKETYFLRHIEEIEDVDWRAAADRAAAAGRPLRMWSAGCSSGEEPYSLAMLASEALGAGRPPIDMLGSDLSATALTRAAEGRYGTRSMRLVGRARRARWFVADGELLRVGDELRRLVRFVRHNLVHDPFPPAGEAPFDLIVCRNVLIYFDAPTVARVVASLQWALAPGGRLVLGTVDRLGSAPPTALVPPARVEDRRTRAEPRLATRRLHRAASTTETAAEAGHAAFEVGSRALSAGKPAIALDALRRALYLDPRRAVVALQLARAHEALNHAEAAQSAYRRALWLADQAPDPGARLYDRIAAGDVAAACRARLAILAEA